MRVAMAEVKNEYSKDPVPLDERLAEILVKWKAGSPLQLKRVRQELSLKGKSTFHD
jgi:hypothetical protein